MLVMLWEWFVLFYQRTGFGEYPLILVQRSENLEDHLESL